MPNGAANGGNMFSMTDATVANSGAAAPDNKKNLLIYIACGAITLISIIIAIFSFMDSSSKAAEIKKLKKQITSGEEVVIDGQTVSGTRTKNPVISAPGPEVYNVEYSSINYELDNGTTYHFSLAVRDGEVFTCTAKEFSSTSDGYKENNKQCAVNNVSGKIYKVFDIIDPSDSQNDLLGFVLEDGTIDFVKIYVGLKNMQFNVVGKINPGGFVTDVMTIKAFQQDSVSGKEVVGFTLSDGSFVQYKKSMLKYN